MAWRGRAAWPISDACGAQRVYQPPRPVADGWPDLMPWPCNHSTWQGFIHLKPNFVLLFTLTPDLVIQAQRDRAHAGSHTERSRLERYPRTPVYYDYQ